MALDDFFKRQREYQEQKKAAERALYEKQRKEREAKEEFEKKLPDFFKDVVDRAMQTVVDKFKQENLDGLYANIGRRFRAARPTQRISRDYYVDFHRNAIQFYIYPQTDNFFITVEVSTDPRIDEFKKVDSSKNYTMEEFDDDLLLHITGTALEKLEALVNKDKKDNKENKDEKVIRMQ